jgi:hypothetical protein
MLLFAQYTARAPQRLLIATALFSGCALIGSVVAATASIEIGTKAMVVTGALLVAGTIAVIGRRLATHTIVSSATILGALSVYLLLGLLFSYIYATIGAFSSAPFFGNHPNALGWDFLYFSYITMTTVGYGDLVVESKVGQLAAVCEALVGQIYLVTVVSLAVSRIGTDRLPRDRPPP